MRPPSPSIPEKEFFFNALSHSLRLDGRSPLASRPVDIVFGQDLGYVEVAMGKTRVIASVSAEMIRPAEERPYEGILSVHAELSPMAGVEYESGR
jgi:exosome complex component RRP45